MSHIISCDGGCGFTSNKDSDFEKLGVIFKKEYCIECALVVKNYLGDKDKVHDEATLLWLTKTNHLVEEYKKKFPNGELPDE